MDRTLHRPSLILTQPEIVQQSKATILMAKVKELYEKLALQISENESLLEQNQKLKMRVSELEAKSPQEHPQQHSDSSLSNNNPVFNLFVDKISQLENQNKKLRQEKERSSHNFNQWHLETISQNQNYDAKIMRRPSIANYKYSTPQCSTICFSSQDQNLNIPIPINPCCSPRYSNLSKKTTERQNNTSRKQLEIDRLWLSPSRKNLQKLIQMGKNR